MTTKDDALIEAMADAIDAIPSTECRGKSSRQLCEIFARAALAVARAAILEEAAKEVEEVAQSIGVWSTMHPALLEAVARIRALANQEQP